MKKTFPFGIAISYTYKFWQAAMRKIAIFNEKSCIRAKNHTTAFFLGSYFALIFCTSYFILKIIIVIKNVKRENRKCSQAWLRKTVKD